MEIADLEGKTSTVSYGALLEKIEIMRSTLRWPQNLDRSQIQKLFNQTNSLREEVLRLSHTERIVQAKSRGSQGLKQNIAERRQGLLDREFQFDGVFGDSRKLIESLEIAEKAAPTDLPVLIDGESGTGKELMAKVIHANGARAEQQLITVNCGAIPDSLLESELFGHKKGAFTGASSDRAGKFEAANGGTNRGGRPHCGSDQQEPARDVRGGHFPRRPLLPFEHHSGNVATAQGAERRD
jgi:transcriptional regulator with GAF, ATPase, and Fis domain